MLLAIDTSCDETALAILDIKKVLAGEVLSEKLLVSEVVSSQIKLHEPYGGVVPELAAREHFNNLPILFENILSQAKIKKDDISTVAVTRGPGLNGCLLVGLCFAKAFAAMRKLQLLALNHVEGHIFSAELMGKPLQYPALALVVSGGHTMLVFMKSFRRYEIIAKTRDDAAGEAFDKSANLLGLGYPGGAILSQRAALGNALAYKLPVGLAGVNEAFSFSGLKTAVGRLVNSLAQSKENLSEQIINDVAAAVQQAIIKALVDKTVAAMRRVRPRNLILVGGVAANQYLRIWLENEAREQKVEFIVPERRWCTDNASMIASLAARVLLEGQAGISDFYISALPQWSILDI
ncbi:MAG: tRNA (adenosine(37)-N6)-threonylcarbamoyltransferase complex transferase subunit TsaD [Deltaproteobacteria bacterium]|jgi:N6-L-threonylcarbamoyladenine synthase|nr:tRNA (adenosine(37)-N6)-threonylcarbamoyltransferase complex transferase subunit TsaD [Deltaproteobacteria bacterium]